MRDVVAAGDRGQYGIGRVQVKRRFEQTVVGIDDDTVVQLGENLVPPVDGYRALPTGAVSSRIADPIQQHSGGALRSGDLCAGVQ